MNFNIIGEYCFKIPLTTMFLNEVIRISNKNMITLLGESFFLNRCINDLFNPIQYVCIGSGINAPQKLDDKLGNETKRNTCIQEVDLDNKCLVLTTSFMVEDLIGATEIGVLTTNLNGKEVLISRDVFSNVEISESLMYGVTGSVSLEYLFYFSTSQFKSGWAKYGNDKNVYWVFEPNEVMRIYDNTTQYGLRKVNSVAQVQDTKNSYYHDTKSTNNLYIHLYHQDIAGKVTYADNPNTHDILVENK